MMFHYPKRVERLLFQIAFVLSCILTALGAWRVLELVLS